MGRYGEQNTTVANTRVCYAFEDREQGVTICVVRKWLILFTRTKRTKANIKHLLRRRNANNANTPLLRGVRCSRPCFVFTFKNPSPCGTTRKGFAAATGHGCVGRGAAACVRCGKRDSTLHVERGC
jgi:hypothetical protein